MTRGQFTKLVEEAVDAFPPRFRLLVENLAVIVEDVPPGQPDPQTLLSANPEESLQLGLFAGVPTTEKSVWDATGPDRIVLYQKNIEAVCESEEEIREQVRLTVLHELGHYFGMQENQLEDV